MTLEQRRKIWAAIADLVMAPTNGDRQDAVWAAIEELEKEHQPIGHIEACLDFLTKEFGEFLLITRLASRDRHAVVSITDDDDEGCARLERLARAFADGTLKGEG